jgi:hypothetical protein
LLTHAPHTALLKVSTALESSSGITSA